MKINKKLRSLAIGGLIALNSLMPLKTHASEPEYSKQPISQELSKEENKSSNKLLNLSKTFANWYAADAIMVAMHESGHYDEDYSQKLDPYTKFSPGALWINGSSGYKNNPKTKMDEAKIDVAGFVNTGKLASQLRNEIDMGVPKEELKFKSMLALACELNLPVYLGMHYLGSADKGDDIQNFSDNSGVKAENIAIGSGLNLILNSPYLYKLVKNAASSNPESQKNKKLDVYFRFDGNSCSVNVNADLDSLLEKIKKPNFSRIGSKF